LIAQGLVDVKSVAYPQALAACQSHDYVAGYVDALAEVIDFAAIRAKSIKIGVDPMGGSGIAFWQAIAERYQLDLTVVNDRVDPAFSFMPLDKDGKIRMDCSSPWSMANLIALKDQFAIGIGNDPDFDRHGIVTRSGGLMNPNHYLAVAIDYLLSHRPQWQARSVGKTLVSSAMIDRVVQGRGYDVYEVPVGFKWFVQGLHQGKVLFGGEESAGASFLKFDGSVWTTDKDGFILGLLAAEMLATTGKDPYQRYVELTAEFGAPLYKRLDAPASLAQRNALKKLDVSSVTQTQLAGDAILGVMTKAPGNQADIGGVKVVTANGWFAARPSGTENSYKIYLESFVSEEHLALLEQDARRFVDAVFQQVS
jgi:phosphoglucomutase